ncbi:MAG: aspartate aminotransferase family protein [Chitinophagales bacterium]
MLTQRQLFLQHVAQTSDAPLGLEIERAEGVYLYDVTGKKYIDLISGIGVSALGHCHPKVVQAVQEQAAKYMHTMVYGEYVQSPQVQLAKYVCDVLPSTLNAVYFTNSGTEATEGAMKLAKRYTGRTEIISCYHSYHGSTQGSLSLNGDEYFKSAYRPLLPDVRQICYNTFEDIQSITKKTAAIFLEPVQAEAGIIVPEKGYLQAVRKRCEETGTLLVFDEIQTGCGRTGNLFRFQMENVVPDILLVGKAFGGGLPLAAFIADAEIMQVLQNNPVLGHITTFGGNAVCCAAGLASLQIISEQKLYEQAAQKAQLFIQLLNHPAIQKIHHCGLMMAVYLDNFDNLRRVIAECLENGLITDWFLFANNCMRIAPPLIITEEEIQVSCGIINKALDKVYK